MTSFTLEQLQRVADIYAKYVGVRHVQVTLMGKLCSKLSPNPVAHAHSPEHEYRNYLNRAKLYKLKYGVIKPHYSRRTYMNLFGTIKRRKICITPTLLAVSKPTQIAVIIHELIHFTRTPKHGKKFYEKEGLWMKRNSFTRRTVMTEYKTLSLNNPVTMVSGEEP